MDTSPPAADSQLCTLPGPRLVAVNESDLADWWVRKNRYCKTPVPSDKPYKLVFANADPAVRVCLRAGFTNPIDPDNYSPTDVLGVGEYVEVYVVAWKTFLDARRLEASYPGGPR